MTPSQTAYTIIKGFEGLRLHAYPDPGTGGKPYTIGYGSTMYQDGSKVQPDDHLNVHEATKILEWEVNNKAIIVDRLTSNTMLNQNQFDSLVSFAYNVGVGAFAKSTLLKKVRLTPNDPAIRAEFNKWNKAGGRVLAGLTARRKKEADLYFS